MATHEIARHLVGYSTGALPSRDPEAGMHESRQAGIDAVELSALRYEELRALRLAFQARPFEYFRYLSVHMPSKFQPNQEREIADAAFEFTRCGHNVVVHPDTIRDFALWREHGQHLLLENMDARKGSGFTLDSMAELCAELPEARVCLDVAHVFRQSGGAVHLDRMVRLLWGKIAQLHWSQLDRDFRHVEMGHDLLEACRVALADVPPVPVILEAYQPRANAGIRNLWELTQLQLNELWSLRR